MLNAAILTVLISGAPMFIPGEMICDGGEPITIDECENPCPVLADWDNDGLKDMIVAVVQNENPPFTRYRLYRNISGGGDPVFDGWEYLMQEDGDTLETGFSYSNCPGYCAGVPQVVDWDGDSDPDLVTSQATDESGSLHVHFNTGNGLLMEPVPIRGGDGNPVILTQTGCAMAQVTDYNADGKYDLLIGMGYQESWNYCFLFLNDPDTWAPPYNPVFTGPDTLTSCGEYIEYDPSAPFVCDLDGDGFPDLLNSTTETLFFFYQGTGPAGTTDFEAMDTLCCTEGIMDSWDVPHLHGCDWDSDGDLDILTGSNGFSYWEPNGIETHIYLFRNILNTGIEDGPELGCASICAASPASGTACLMLSAPGSSCASVKLLDLSGRSLRHARVGLEANGKGECSLALEGLSAGLYLCVMTSSTGTASAQLIVLE